MLSDGSIEQVFELVKENDEKVFTSEYHDVCFTFLGLVDDVLTDVSMEVNLS